MKSEVIKLVHMSYVYLCMSDSLVIECRCGSPFLPPTIVTLRVKSGVSIITTTSCIVNSMGNFKDIIKIFCLFVTSHMQSHAHKNVYRGKVKGIYSDNCYSARHILLYEATQYSRFPVSLISEQLNSWCSMQTYHRPS